LTTIIDVRLCVSASRQTAKAMHRKEEAEEEEKEEEEEEEARQVENP